MGDDEFLITSIEAKDKGELPFTSRVDSSLIRSHRVSQSIHIQPGGIGGAKVVGTPGFLGINLDELRFNPNAVKSGWLKLRNQGFFFKSWRRHYCVLTHDGQLKIYDKLPTSATDKPVKIIELNQLATSNEVPEQMSRNDHYYVFSLKSLSGHEYSLSCASSYDRSDWFASIQQNALNRMSRSDLPSSKHRQRQGQRQMQAENE